MAPQASDYALALKIFHIETKVDAIIKFLSNLEHFNQDEIGSLKSFVEGYIKQEKEEIASKAQNFVSAKE